MERTDEMARPRRSFGAPATASLVAAIAVTWAYERARFGARPTIAELHVLGGLSWDALRLGEPWRLPAASLLHASWRHVLEDAAAVAAVGVVLERRTSSPTVAATLALGCIGASVGALVQLPGGLTIGASGLVFALLGLGATLPGRGVRVVAAVLLVAGLVAGAAALLASFGHAEATSLGSHIGGAVAGLLVGALARSPWQRALRPLVVVTTCVLVAALAVGAAPMVAASSPSRWAGDGSAPTALDPALVERALEGFPARSPIDVVHAGCRRRVGHRISCVLREREGRTARVWFANHSRDLALEQVTPP